MYVGEGAERLGKCGWHSSQLCLDLWLRKGITPARSDETSVPGHKTILGKLIGLLPPAEIYYTEVITTQRRQRASHNKFSIVLGKIKHFLTHSFVRHLGHTEVRGKKKNNRIQNSTALRGKDDKIMAL